MTKEIKKYLAEAEAAAGGGVSPSERARFLERMPARIAFYQHERLIHLLVTIFCGLVMIIAFAAGQENGVFLVLAVVVAGLEFPYLWHYYFLENSVQRLYKLYYALLDLTGQGG
ncbi:MAG: hypothetical protein LBU36_01365 [Clostridiales bacterium]|jgi:VIT1/CCC1 family predicted Fe2+/Mn2+ transporter|nr:hypothetical protein [Clostridiales bacterium]